MAKKAFAVILAISTKIRIKNFAGRGDLVDRSLLTSATASLASEARFVLVRAEAHPRDASYANVVDTAHVSVRFAAVRV